MTRERGGGRGRRARTRARSSRRDPQRPAHGRADRPAPVRLRRATSSPRTAWRTYDAKVYREANPDLAQARRRQALEAHYRRNAAIQNRLASLHAVDAARPTCACATCRSASCSPITPRSIKDLEPLQGAVLQRAVPLGPARPAGAAADRALEVPPVRSRAEPADRRRAAAGRDGRSSASRSCILIHAFYPDLLPELVGFARNFRDVVVRHVHQRRGRGVDAGDARRNCARSAPALSSCCPTTTAATSAASRGC